MENTTTETATPKEKPDFLDRYLETDKLLKDGITLKSIADNLRSYPVIVVLWIAIGYLWSAPSTTYISAWIPKTVSLLWGSWLALFSFLTAIQSGFLIICALIDLLKSHDALSRPRVKRVAIYLVAILAVAFMFGAWFIAEGILEGVRR